MEPPLQRLLELLDVEQLEKHYFRAYSPTDREGRIFGGQVLGQALMAAGRTVEPGRRVHSLQSYFMLGGDPTVPVMLEVERIRDGRSFTTRRVRAFQHGEAIFALSASFHIDEPGPEHQSPPPAVPPPEEISPDAGPFARRPNWGLPFEIRWHDAMTDGTQPMWFRVGEALPDDPLLHACLLAFVSDMGLVATIARPHTDDWWPRNFMMASLDHMMWFHRPFRVDEWLLYSRHSPSAFGGRGLALGSIHARSGALLASVAQEGLIRPLRGDG